MHVKEIGSQFNCAVFVFSLMRTNERPIRERQKRKRTRVRAFRLNERQRRWRAMRLLPSNEIYFFKERNNHIICIQITVWECSDLVFVSIRKKTVILCCHSCGTYIRRYFIIVATFGTPIGVSLLLLNEWINSASMYWMKEKNIKELVWMCYRSAQGACHQPFRGL